MENKIQALLIEAAQKLNTSICYDKSTRVEVDGVINITHFISYILGESFEYMPVCQPFKHSMEVVIYLESLINPE